MTRAISGIAQEDFTTEADGHWLTARWLRPADSATDAPAIVFLHEGLGCIGMWDDFPAEVVKASGLPALIYDRYGHGGSDAMAADERRPPDWMEHEALAVLPAVLAGCGVERPILFGHSDGGTIALIHAAHHACAAVVTEAAHIFQDERTFSGQAHALKQWRSGKLPAFLAPYHGPRAERVFFGWYDHWSDPAQADMTLVPLLADIACPMLAIQGDKDTFGLVGQLDGIAEGVSGPATRLLIPDCGHIPHHQARQAVMAAVTDFLAAHGFGKGVVPPE